MAPAHEPANPDARITEMKRRTAANRRLFALVRETGMSDEDRRAKVAAVTGKASAAKCTAAELIAVCDAIDPRKRGRGTPDGGRPTHGRMRALWINLWNLGALEDGSDAALAAFARRQSGIDDPRWVPADEAGSVIEALKAVLLRHGVRIGAETHPGPILVNVLTAQRQRLAALGALPVGDGETDMDCFGRLFQEATGQPWNHRARVDTMQRAAQHFGGMIRVAQKRQFAQERKLGGETEDA